MVKKSSFTGSRFSLDSSPVASADSSNNNNSNLAPFLFRRRSSHASVATSTSGSGSDRSRKPSDILGLSPSSGRRPSELLGLSSSSGRRASEVLGLSPAAVSRQYSASAAVTMSEASRKRISLDVPWWRAKKNAPRPGNPVVGSNSSGTPLSPRYVNVRATDFIEASVSPPRFAAKTVTIEPNPAVAKPRPPSIEFPKLNLQASPLKNSNGPNSALVTSPTKPPAYVVNEDTKRIEKLEFAMEQAGLKESPFKKSTDEQVLRDNSLENAGLRRLSSNARDDIDTSISSWSERASTQKPPINDILWPRPERPNLIIKSSAVPPIAARCFYPSPPPLPTPPLSERSSFTSECALRSSITETDSDGNISESDNESTTSSITENILRQSWNKLNNNGSIKKEQNPANSSMTSTVLSGSSSDDDSRQKNTNNKYRDNSSVASGNTSTIAHHNIQVNDDVDEGVDDALNNNNNNNNEESTSESSETSSENGQDVLVDSEYGADIVDSEEEISGKQDPRILKAGMLLDDETESDTESEIEKQEYKKEEEEAMNVAVSDEEEKDDDEKEEDHINNDDNNESNSLPFLNISEDSENEPFVNASEDSSSSSCNSSSSGGTCAKNDSMTELLKQTEREVESEIAAKNKKRQEEEIGDAEEEEITYGDDGFSEPDADDLWSDSEPSSIEEQRKMIRNATPLPKQANKKPSKLVARFFDPNNEAESSKVATSSRSRRSARRRFSAYASSSKRISKGALAARLKKHDEYRNNTHANKNKSNRSSRKSMPASITPSTNVVDPSPSMDLSTVSVASSDEEFDPNMD